MLVLNIILHINSVDSFITTQLMMKSNLKTIGGNNNWITLHTHQEPAKQRAHHLQEHKIVLIHETVATKMHKWCSQS